LPSQFVFDRETLELVSIERYATTNACMLALLRHTEDGKLATAVEAENEATLRATRDLEEIARDLRQSWERDEAELNHISSTIAGLPYPERRMLELCRRIHSKSLTEAEAAAEIGCSVRTVRKLYRQGIAKVMTQLNETGWSIANGAR
jgi:DNA-directed RNA polymerase specialized sigma24 family protein